MKKFTVLRLDLTDKENQQFNEACRSLASTMPKMATYLVRKFLSEFYNSKKPLFD